MRRITCFLIIQSLLCGMFTAQAQADTDSSWPHPIPCRIQDDSNRDLFVMTLGDVETPLADGIYDPLKDEVRLKDGTVMKNYYRETLKVKYYQPLDKSQFPLPPSGWCTWYYYYLRITATEVKRNAKWIAENLKDYGAQYVQIDDGWQRSGGPEGTRDWTTVNKERFPDGMEDLASYIKSLGLTPGIWLAPHGQSNETVVKENPNVFLRKADGSLDEDRRRWEGPFLVDPSTQESLKYMADLFSMLCKWGYDYFKIDSQTTVVEEYRTKKSFMKNPDDDTDGLYRKTLESIREVIGPDRYLLGCWGIPIEGAGIMNGSRTGGDIVLGWGGFRVALRATMQYYYLHNVLWYSDPDVMMLRSPLTLDQARVWATLQGLTGQALMATDRMMDLSEERVELAKRVYPAVDIRPLDLFGSEQNKRIWDLKINHLNRNYDVVGVFNFDETTLERIYLIWKDMGLPTNQPIHVFDFWNKEYLGAWQAGMMVDVPPTSCRVLTLAPSTNRIQLISTNRHITQGWVDLVDLKYNETANAYTGKSKVIKNDSYELRFVFPRGKNFAVKTVKAHSSSGDLPARIVNHQGWATVQIRPAQTTQVSWEVHFEPADFYQVDFNYYPTPEPSDLRLERVGLDGVNLNWKEQYYLNVGYQVYLNGELLGYTPKAAFTVRGLDPNATYTTEVETVWEDGTASQKKAELKFSLKSMIPKEVVLTQLEPIRSARGFRAAQIGRPVSIGGKQYQSGIAMDPNSEIEYDLKGLFETFSALVGIDEETRGERGAEFLVVGDGKELWRSGVLKKSDTPKPVKVDISGVQRLVLRVNGTDEGPRLAGTQRRSRVRADWVEAKIMR